MEAKKSNKRTLEKFSNPILSVIFGFLDNNSEYRKIRSLSTRFKKFVDSPYYWVNIILTSSSNRTALKRLDEKVIALILEDNSLELLEFSSQISCNAQSDPTYINSLLTNNSALRHLKMSGNLLGAKGAEIISQGLEMNTTLRVLQLMGNLLMDAGVIKVTKAMKKTKTVISLNLSQNMVSSEGFATVLENLTSQNQLETLWFRNNKISTITKERFEDFLRSCPKLSTIDLSTNPFEPESAQLIWSGFNGKASDSLANIWYNYNAFPAECVLSLEEMLKKRPTLTSIELSGIDLRDKNPEAILELFSRHPGLTEVILSSSVVTGTAFERLLNSFTEESQLKKLEVAMSDEAAAWIKPTGVSPSLRYLSVHTARGKTFLSLLSSLQGLPMLECLDIEMESLSFGGVFKSDILLTLKQAPLLSKFSFTLNTFNNSLAQKLYAALMAAAGHSESLQTVVLNIHGRGDNLRSHPLELPSKERSPTNHSVTNLRISVDLFNERELAKYLQTLTKLNTLELYRSIASPYQISSSELRDSIFDIPSLKLDTVSLHKALLTSTITDSPLRHFSILNCSRRDLPNFAQLAPFLCDSFDLNSFIFQNCHLGPEGTNMGEILQGNPNLQRIEISIWSERYGRNVAPEAFKEIVTRCATLPNLTELKIRGLKKTGVILTPQEIQNFENNTNFEILSLL